MDYNLIRDALESLKKNNGRNCNTIAKDFGVDSSALRRKYQALNIQNKGFNKRGPRPVLSPECEKMINSFACYMSSVNLALDNLQLRRTAIALLEGVWH